MSKKREFEWVLALFGTAIGAGILFLPIRAGASGIVSVIIMTLIIYPAVWLGHKALASFVVSAKTPGSDITDAMKEHLGQKAGRMGAMLYFFCLWPICMAYAVGLTNTVGSFIINQLGFSQFSLQNYGFRSILAMILVGLVVAILIKGRDLVLKVTNYLVYPLIIVLVCFSVYLIPSWKLDAIHVMPDWKFALGNIWLTLPVLVFAFNHSPALSSMVQDLHTVIPEQQALRKSVGKVEFMASTILTVFVMFFVISCMLALSPEQFAQARAQNIPILSYFANLSGSRFIGLAGPLVAFVAIGSSFFTHLLGCIEGLRGSILHRTSEKTDKEKAKIDVGIIAGLYVMMVLMAVFNPNVLDFIEGLGGPIIAAIVFLMPVYGFYKSPTLAIYRKNWIANAFIFTVGIFTVTSVVFKLLGGA